MLWDDNKIMGWQLAMDRFAKLTRLYALQGVIKLLADQREQHIKLCSKLTGFMGSIGNAGSWVAGYRVLLLPNSRFQRQDDNAREKDIRFVDGGGMVDVQGVPGPSSVEAEEVVDDPLLDFL